MQPEHQVTVLEYVRPDGKNPFRDWLSRLDVRARARIQARIWRFSTGNFGDHKAVGAGVFEARIAFGPGYRVYFGRVRQTAILLLLGGDKSGQRRDIERAQNHWRDYTEESAHGAKK